MNAHEAAAMSTTSAAKISASAVSTNSSPAAPAARHKNVILVSLLVAQFMAVLDVTIVNVASPSIRADLHTSGSVLQLIVAGYTVMYSTLLITGARFGDRFGYSRVFGIGIFGFTSMSLLCGLAPNATVLVIARLLQGTAAAFMMPQVMSLIQRTFEGQGRARAIGLYGAVIAIGAIVGQIVGGLLVTANIFGLGWRPIFLVNVPIGIVLGILVFKFMPRHTGDSSRGFDPLGVVSIMATVACLVIPLVFGQELGWPVWSIVLLVLVVPLAVACVVHERRMSGRDPIVAREVVDSPGFALILLFMVLMQSSYAGSLLVQALHFESGLGISPLDTGLLFISGGIGFAVGSLTWRRFPARVHPYFLVVGMLVGAAGFVVIALTLSGAAYPGLLYLILNLVLSAAFGYGFGPVLSMALASVPLRFAGSASGVLVSTLQIGQLLGIAVYGSIYFALEPSRTTAAASASAFASAVLWAAGACVVGAIAGAAFVRIRATAKAKQA
jgi:EmrB/QacA subfamily drug resistance transporter